ncbi:MAG: RHS repeat-associated core domain-containing protein, partial [Candidatus Limnocylindrus sp.]
LKLDYGYNKLHDRTFERYGSSGQPGDAFEYDKARRLTVAWMGSSTPSSPSGNTYVNKIQYGMDDDGNRTTVTVTPYGSSPVNTSYTDNNLNQYTAVGGVSRSHDGNGNVSDDGTYLYEYNYKNLICRVKLKSNSSTVAEYKYDALGRRVEKVITGATYRYIYSGVETVSVYTSTGTWKQDYVYGPVIDEVLLLEQADVLDWDGDSNTSELARSWYRANALGSVMRIEEPDRTEAVSYRYDPYGEVAITRGGSAQGSDPLGQYVTGTGRWRDEETGLYHYRARAYDPGRGRFLQRDPHGFSDGPNMYEYVRSRPGVCTDPTGCSILEAIENLFKVGPWDTGAAGNDASRAENAAKASGLPGAHNGFQDAFRHCLWNCFMTRSIGADQAKEVADNHEDRDSSQPQAERSMDLYNNRQGRTCGRLCGASCVNCCWRMLQNGDLAIITKTSSDGTPVEAERVPYTGGNTQPEVKEKEYKKYG